MKPHQLFSRRGRQLATATVLAVLAALVGVAAPADAEADDSCRQQWGSLTKQSTTVPPSATHVDDIRSGRHDCFDRIVIDLDGPATGYVASYVDDVIVEGSPLSLRGGAFIDLRVNAPNHDAAGNPTYDPPDGSEVVSVAGYQTLRQVALGQPFDDQLQIGIGVRARLPFQVFALDGPGNGSRVVVDIGHRWYPEQPPATRTVQVFHNTGDGTDCAEVTGYSRDATGVTAPIGYALDRLVAGPTADEQALGASSFFSADTADSIRSVNLRPDGLLIVDFADIRGDVSGASSSCGSAAFIASLDATVFQFPEVARVQYQINGSCADFWEFLQRSCHITER
jgi:hypothetical protein